MALLLMLALGGVGGFCSVVAAFVPSSTSVLGYRRLFVPQLRQEKRPEQVNGFLPSVRSFSSSHLLRSVATPQVNTNKKKVPVSILSGFLGSGKTSTLKNLLENAEGTKIGVIVNDVASINIDAKLVAEQSSDLVRLENGCACCSLSDELLSSINDLMSLKDTSFDAIVVELSGVADPVTLRGLWNIAQGSNHPVTKKAEFSKVITLVDACTFGRDYMTSDSIKNRWQAECQDSPNRGVTELLLEQVEAASLILINKVDLAGPERTKTASAVARSINEDADVVEVKFGRVPARRILGDGVLPEKPPEKKKSGCGCSSGKHSHSCSSSKDKAKETSCADPDCVDTPHSETRSRPSITVDTLGITNFVYTRDRPFHPKKLLGLLDKWPVPVKEDLDLSMLKEIQEMGYLTEEDGSKVSILEQTPFLGVLRSKGFCWMAPQKWSGPNNDAVRHDTAYFWSHAGTHFGVSPGGRWWASEGTKAELKRKFSPELYEKFLAEDYVSEEWGDRRQQLVFIGIGINEEDISAALDDCLLTPKQMKIYKKKCEEVYGEIYDPDPAVIEKQKDDMENSNRPRRITAIEPLSK